MHYLTFSYIYSLTIYTATFRTPFAALGQTPEGCSTFTFPKIMGEEIAKKVLGEGLVLSAQDALKCGLVNCVVPDENIKDVVTKYCYHIATLSPTDNELIKKIKKENLLEKLKDVNLAECEVLEVAVVSKECFTALATYLDSRNMKIAAFMMRFVSKILNNLHIIIIFRFSQLLTEINSLRIFMKFFLIVLLSC